MKRYFIATNIKDLGGVVPLGKDGFSQPLFELFEKEAVLGYNDESHKFEPIGDITNYNVFLVNDNGPDPLNSFAICQESDYLLYHENSKNKGINDKFIMTKTSHHEYKESSLYFKLMKMISSDSVTSSAIINSLWPSSQSAKESIIDFVMKLLGSNNKPELPEILMDIQGKYDPVSDADVAKLSENLRIFVNECLERLKP